MAVIVNILLVIFIPVCLLLILVVLLQAGKGGGLSGAFGGMGSQPFLGARGTANFLSKMTIYLAIAFISLSLILAIAYGPSRTFRMKEKAPAVSGTETATPQEGAAKGTASPAKTPASSGAKTAPAPTSGSNTPPANK